MRLRHHSSILALVLTLAFAVGTPLLILHGLHNPRRGLPHTYSFRTGDLGKWRAFGGTWNVNHDTIQNDSDQRGAKLVTGSPYWNDYSVEADVELLGPEGDAGLVVRSSHNQTGVDAYHGYYVGLRDRENDLNTDNSLILGKADFHYTSLKTLPIPGGIIPFRWYRLKVLVYGCRIVASVTWPIHSHRTFTASAFDHDCYAHGRIGLRSYASGGAWKDITIRPATKAEMRRMLATPPPQPSAFRKREPKVPLARTPPAAPNLIAIDQLRRMSFATQNLATVRGIVISTAPRLYVQGSSGGVRITAAKEIPLKIGDEVQATGRVIPGDFSPTLKDATVHLLWESTPMPPIFATPSQASTGTFAARFIEVHGHLESKHYSSRNALVLRLQEGQQPFQALLYGEQAHSLFDSLRPGSLLSVRGVCVVSTKYTHDVTPFAVLLRSGNDITVIHGPPWATPPHIIESIIGFFLVVLFALYLRLRIERWRLHAVLDERARLAHEMHDTLAQSFAGIGFQLEAIRNELRPEDTVYRHLDTARDLVRYSHEEARRNIASLRPEFLASHGLVNALRQFAESCLTGGKIQIKAEGNDAASTLPTGIIDTLFRIGQEAIANSVRHACPSTIEIRLRTIKNRIEFIIKDDGIGFDTRASHSGFGLDGMRKRAELISADFELCSSAQNGTSLTIRADRPVRPTWKSFPKHVWSFVTDLYRKWNRQ